MFWVPWMPGYRRRICGLLFRKWGVIAIVAVIMVISPRVILPLLTQGRLASTDTTYAIALLVTVGATVYMYLTRAVPPIFGFSESQVSPITLNMIEWVKKKAEIECPVHVLRANGPLNMGVDDRPGSCTFLIRGPLEQILSLEELEAVIAHEFAHVKARDTLVVVLMSSLVVFHIWLSLLALFSFNIVGYWVASLFAAIFFVLMTAYQRLTEYLADLGALQILGAERHEDIATALIKIEAINFIATRNESVIRTRTIWSSHPAIDDRLKMLAP